MNGRKKLSAKRASSSKGIKGTCVLGALVPFSSPGATTDDGWTVLAYEVAMKTSGMSFTRADFEDCVKNFASYPCAPITIEHADLCDDLMPPPKEWREPNGHIEELRVGTMKRGDATVATLEGRPSYLPDAERDVKARKWRFGSVAMFQGATSEETGAKLGSLLWSWSLTAHPRLTDMPAIAASARPDTSSRVVQAGYWWGDLDSREDVLSMLRSVLDLPVTTNEADTLVQLDRLAELTAGGEDATGIDTDHIIGQLRDALRLPALTTVTQVIAEVRKALETLPTEMVTTTDGETGITANAKPPTHTENPMKFTAILAALGLAAAASEDAAEKTVVAHAQLGLDALKALGLPPNATAADLAKRAADLATAAARLPALDAEVASYRAEKAEAEKALRAAWVTDVIEATPALAPVKASLELHAERDWEGFQKAYPRPDRTALVTAAAENAQRAQDAQRKVVVAGGNAPGSTKDAPVAAGKPVDLRREIASVLREYGRDDDAETITGVIAMGHTPESLRAVLAQG